jgi:hypothetical protein
MINGIRLVGSESDIVQDMINNNLDCIFIHVYEPRDTAKDVPERLLIVDTKGAWNPDWGRNDPVQDQLIELSNSSKTGLIDLAHAANIQVYAIVSCFGEHSGYSPGSDPNYEQKLRDVIDYMVTNYEVDGVALDFIRYSDNIGNHDANAVNKFLDDTRELSISGRVSLMAFCAVQHWLFDPARNGEVLTYDEAKQKAIYWYGQDWEDMAQFCDYLIPMNYAGIDPVGIGLDWAYDNISQYENWIMGTMNYFATAIAARPTSCQFMGSVQAYDELENGTWKLGGTGRATAITMDIAADRAILKGACGAFTFKWGDIAPAEEWNAIGRHSFPGQDLPIAACHISPLMPEAGAAFELDASDSRGLHGPISVSVDWNNDNVYDEILPENHIGTHMFADPGEHRILLKAVDALGLKDTYVMDITVVLPTLTLIAPEDDATVYANVGTIFSWSAVSGATSYDLQFDSDTPISVPETSWNLVSSTLGVHSWKVRAMDGSGAGPWSSIRIFTIVGVPSTPTLTSPGDGATIDYGVTTSFMWTSSANATGYDIQFDSESPVSVGSTSYSRAFSDLGAHIWKVRATNPAGITEWSATSSFTVQNPTGVHDTPLMTKLAQNYPNPFNPITTIDYSLARSGRVQLSIFNVTGTFVRKLVDANMDRGNYRVNWDGKDSRGRAVASGPYIYVLRTEQGDDLAPVVPVSFNRSGS